MPEPTTEQADREFYRLREQHQSGNHCECPVEWCLDVRPGSTDLLAALGQAVESARTDQRTGPGQRTPDDREVGA